MREIIFDTETTGLDPVQGHRMVEIGCVELVNRFPSGRTFHRYFNPQRDMPPEAFAVHGLSVEFLSAHACFQECIEELLEFIGDAPLVAHNATFDLAFLNAELEKCARRALGRERLVDTLLLARRKHPGGSNRLDDLCIRYKIDHSRRTKHGALLDAELLAEVYIELIGARQASFGLADSGFVDASIGDRIELPPRPAALPARISTQELDAHRSFVATLGDAAIWKDYAEA